MEPRVEVGVGHPSRVEREGRRRGAQHRDRVRDYLETVPRYLGLLDQADAKDDVLRVQRGDRVQHLLGHALLGGRDLDDALPVPSRTKLIPPRSLTSCTHPAMRIFCPILPLISAMEGSSSKAPPAPGWSLMKIEEIRVCRRVFDRGDPSPLRKAVEGGAGQRALYCSVQLA